jgi:hypothetical protein
MTTRYYLDGIATASLKLNILVKASLILSGLRIGDERDTGSATINPSGFTVPIFRITLPVLEVSKYPSGVHIAQL